MTTTINGTTKVERDARLRWVPIAKMKVNPLAQRELNQSRVDNLVANFDLEEIGTPTVNERGGLFYIIDGQHRIEALRAMGWGDQQIQCWTYSGLTEEQEAEKFLKLNDVLTVHAFPKFKAAVSAGREIPCDIDRIVRAHGLVVSQDKVPGAIGAVAALQGVYQKGGPNVLSRTLNIANESFGDGGMEGPIISGLGLLCSRYNGSLDDAKVISRLSATRGGVNGVLNRAEKLRLQTGAAKPHCVAAAVVDIVNAGKGGKKLPGWWKTGE